MVVLAGGRVVVVGLGRIGRTVVRAVGTTDEYAEVITARDIRLIRMDVGRTLVVRDHHQLDVTRGTDPGVPLFEIGQSQSRVEPLLRP